MYNEMYNENDFESIDLDEEIEIKQQLESIIVDNVDDDFLLFNCCVNKNENKIYYCYCGYVDGDTFYVKVDFNNDSLTEIDDDELKEIIFNC